MGDDGTTVRPVDSRPARAEPDIWRLVFIAVLAVWLVMPVLASGKLAQDGVALYVAGELVTDRSDQIYIDDDGDLYDPPPAFHERSCELVPDPAACDDVVVSFVSTPLALGPVAALGALDFTLAILLVRLAAAACLVGGMALIWRRLADRSPDAPRWLALTAVLLTPVAALPIDLGQTAPMLFLCALLAPADDQRGWRREAVWVLTTAFKGFPAVLGLHVLAERQWRVVARTAALVAALALLGLLLGPPSLWSDFAAASATIAGQGAQNPYNGAIEGAVWQVAGVDIGGTLSIATALRLLVLACVPLVAARVHDRDVRWALWLLGSLLLVPQVWWHYLWLAIAAVAVALAARGVPARLLPLLPATALAALPIAVPYAGGSPAPAAQLGYLLAAVALTLWIALQATPPERSPGATPEEMT